MFKNTEHEVYMANRIKDERSVQLQIFQQNARFMIENNATWIGEYMSSARFCCYSNTGRKTAYVLHMRRRFELKACAKLSTLNV
jgi:hypothetical protein